MAAQNPNTEQGCGLFKTIVEQSVDGIVVVDHAGTVLFANPAAEHILGREAENLIGMSFGFPVAEERPSELTVIRKDGTTGVVELRAVQCPWEGKDAFLASLRDISDRVRVQESLLRAQKETKALLAANRAVLDSPDFESAAQKIFKICKEQTGATAGYVALRIGENENGVLFLDPGRVQCTVDPTLPMPIRGLRAEAYKHNKTVYENNFQGSDYEDYLPEGHASLKNVLFAPITVDNEVKGIIGLANKDGGFTEDDARRTQTLGEITALSLERDRFIRDLKDSEELLTSTGRMARVGGWQLDMATKKVRWTRVTREIHEVADEYEPTLEEAIDFFAPEDRPKLTAALDAAMKEGEPFNLELGFYTATGRRLWTQAKCTPVVLEGKVVKLQGTFQDITERKRLQAQLLQSQKMETVGRLAGGVAHDLNNTLTIILGNTELALDQLDPKSPVWDSLNEIDKAGKRSAEITQQLMAFARKQIISPKVLDLNKTVADLLKMLRRLIGEDIKLIWEPAANLWSVKMDPAQVYQVLANLCINARDAIGEVGQIIIETENVTIDEVYWDRNPEAKAGAFVKLAVSDNGCGMDKETLKNIFEPFFTTKELGKGTGLGLSTVYGIIKQNNGFINAYSEPGEGSTFKVYLPRHQEEGEMKETQDKMQAP